MYPEVLKELAGIFSRLLPIIFERSWRLEADPCKWRKTNPIPSFQRARRMTEEPQAGQLHIKKRKQTEEQILGITSLYQRFKKREQKASRAQLPSTIKLLEPVNKERAAGSEAG